MKACCSPHLVFPLCARPLLLLLLLPFFTHNIHTRSSFTHSIPTYNSFTHTNSLTRTTLSHTAFSHTTFPHTCAQLFHTQHSHMRNSFTHTQRSHIQLFHAHAHNIFCHTHNFHTQLFCSPPPPLVDFWPVVLPPFLFPGPFRVRPFWARCVGVGVFSFFLSSFAFPVSCSG